MAAQPKKPRLVHLLQANLNTSAQLPVRLSVFLIVVLLWVANSLGLDVLLGAFTAGIVVRLGIKGPTRTSSGSSSRPSALGSSSRSSSW